MQYLGSQSQLCLIILVNILVNMLKSKMKQDDFAGRETIIYKCAYFVAVAACPVVQSITAAECAGTFLTNIGSDILSLYHKTLDVVTFCR